MNEGYEELLKNLLAYYKSSKLRLHASFEFLLDIKDNKQQDDSCSTANRIYVRSEFGII